MQQHVRPLKKACAMHQSPHPLAIPALADTVLVTPESDFVLAEWTDDGGGFDPPHYLAPRHVHHADDEAFYIVEGSLSFELGGETVRVDAGGAVMIPKGTVHTWWNPSEDRCRYIIVMTRRIHELIQRLHAPDETRSASEIFRAFSAELTD